MPRAGDSARWQRSWLGQIPRRSGPAEPSGSPMISAMAPAGPWWVPRRGSRWQDEKRRTSQSWPSGTGIRPRRTPRNGEAAQL